MARVARAPFQPARLSPDIETGNLLLPVMLGASGALFPILTLRRPGDPSSGPVKFWRQNLAGHIHSPRLKLITHYPRLFFAVLRNISVL